MQRSKKERKKERKALHSWELKARQCSLSVNSQSVAADWTNASLDM